MPTKIECASITAEKSKVKDVKTVKITLNKSGIEYFIEIDNAVALGIAETIIKSFDSDFYNTLTQNIDDTELEEPESDDDDLEDDLDLDDEDEE